MKVDRKTVVFVLDLLAEMAKAVIGVLEKHPDEDEWHQERMVRKSCALLHFMEGVKWLNIAMRCTETL